jgi:hypothetical protein
MASLVRHRGWIFVAFLLVAAAAAIHWAPSRSRVVVSFSSTHGIDTGDLPALALLAMALAVAVSQLRAQEARAALKRLAGRSPWPRIRSGARSARGEGRRR